MEKPIGYDLISKIKNDISNLDNYVKEAPDEEVDGALDLLLFSLLANERKFIDSVRQENILESQTTKNKYKFFNPEAMIGLSYKNITKNIIDPITNEKKQQKFIRIENASSSFFYVGTSSLDQLQKKQKNSVFTIKQKFHTDIEVPEEKQTKTFSQKCKGMDLIASSQYSKYCANEKNEVYFSGIYPRKINGLKTEVDLMSNEELETLMSNKILPREYLHPAESSLETCEIPTFYTIFNGLCNAISHNKVYSKDHYYYFEFQDRSIKKTRPWRNTIVIDKDWTRAVCETIISAKSTMLIDEITNTLYKYITPEKPTKDQVINGVSSCLKEFEIEDCNIETMLKLLNTKIPETVNEKSYTVNKIAEYLSIFDSSLNDEQDPIGLRLPSKLYLILMNQIVESRKKSKGYNDSFEKIYNDLHEDYSAFIKTQQLRLLSQKTPSRNFQSEFLIFQTNALNIIEKHQRAANKLAQPFSGGFIFNPEYLSLDTDLFDETKGILALTQFIYPLNDFITFHFDSEMEKIKSAKLGKIEEIKKQNKNLQNNICGCFDKKEFGTIEEKSSVRLYSRDKHDIDIIGFTNALKSIRVSNYHGDTKITAKGDDLYLKFIRIHDDEHTYSDRASKEILISIETNSLGKLADSNIIDKTFNETPIDLYDDKQISENRDENTEYDYNLPEISTDDKDKNKD